MCVYYIMTDTADLVEIWELDKDQINILQETTVSGDHVNE